MDEPLSDDDVSNNNFELFIYEEGDVRPGKDKFEPLPSTYGPTKAPVRRYSGGHQLHPVKENLGDDRGHLSDSASRHRHSTGRLNRTGSMPGGLRRSISMRSSSLLKKYKITDDNHSENLSSMLSGLYAMFLVVVGASLPISKVFAVDIAIETIDGFYLYLFVVGIIFIVYVYFVIINDVNPVRYIRERRKKGKGKSSSISTEDHADSKDPNGGEGSVDGLIDTETSSDLQSASVIIEGPFSPEVKMSRCHSKVKPHFSFGSKSGSESFYLRLGAVAFGIGSVIHNGLEFGEFLEMTQSGCHMDPVIIVRPVFQLVFTFMQLYFVFINSKLCIHNYCKVSRFGAMHMIATNLCVWLRVITIETVREIHKFLPESIPETVEELLGKNDHDDHHNPVGGHHSSKQNASERHGRAATTLRTMAHVTGSAGGVSSCQEAPIMTSLLNSASAYLYPCAIEYCLIAAAIMFLIWSNIDKPYLRRQHFSILSSNSQDPAEELRLDLFAKRNRVTVDCSGANRGLFSGIFVLVLTVISIIVFFIFIEKTDYVHLAVFVEHASLIVLYSLALVAVLLAAYRFRDFKFRSKRDRHLDEALLVLSLIGVYMFRIFSSIAGQYTADPKDGQLVLAANVIITLQASVQTVFILNGLRRCARTRRQEAHKPGREYVTFLLICNISIWATNTFEVLRSDANPISMNFYGAIPWTIITHVATPLTIFHQFHATVCLSTIWKTTYKLKET